MSRGLGTMQRDILRACESRGSKEGGYPFYVDEAGNRYEESATYHVSWLRWQVARLRGGVCEEDCRAALPPVLRGYGPHKPHLRFMVLGLGFGESFARAMRTLMERGTLIPVAHRVPDITRPGKILEFGGLYPGCGKRILYVVRGKC
jgi:hypothetical protein